MANFLLEIGTEELPADFCRQVIAQLREKALADFQQFRLSHSSLLCTSTPRRIVLFVEGLADVAEDIIEERKGPPASQAFKNGSPTKAASGFATRCGIPIEELEIRETSKGSFVFGKTIEKGKTSKDLLVELIPQWLDGFQGKRFMRWSNGESRFSRPVRWIVSLLDDEVVDVNLLNCDPVIKSNNITQGHRLYSDSLRINSANQYYSIMRESGVEVDRNNRKSIIKRLIDQAASDFNCFPDIAESLLEELTDLVESPSLISGEFDDIFLNLPPEVLTTVMRVHQRYVPLYLSDESSRDPLSLDSKDSLLPSFLCISNGLSSASKNIKVGNERVLRARLSDAKFFVKYDLSIPSNQRNKLLDNVVFAEGLGTLLDRVNRIEWLVSLLLNKIDSYQFDVTNTKRAASLCKHDLVSQMVGEFPELEGIMGGKYLLKEGEPREVALAVLEHYLPRGSKDSLPKSDSGSILAIADKFELLLSIFSKGQRPSGSSDPFALRRAGNGILQILWSKSWRFNMNQFLIESIKYWSNLFPEFNIESSKLFDDLSEFFRQRIISLLEENGIDIDISQAIAGASIPIKSLLLDPSEIQLRANLLSQMRLDGTLNSLNLVVTRASKLAEKSSIGSDILSSSNVINPSLFQKSSEYQLLDVINSIDPIVNSTSPNRYLKLAEILISGEEALAAFFDGEDSVMVMVDDIHIKTNRLNLLAILRNQACILADFSQILL